MSIRDAIVNATREALGSYLAPELVEQLTEEIVHRAAADMESALHNFAGFDLGRPATPRLRANPATALKKGPGRRGRKSDEAAAATAPQRASVEASSTAHERADDTGASNGQGLAEAH